MWKRSKSNECKVMFIECHAFRRACRRLQSTNTTQQQQNLLKLMALQTHTKSVTQQFSDSRSQKLQTKVQVAPLQNGSCGNKQLP